ncbi:MAG: hypothetical protein DRH30_04820 [Deltaproteobacteria bacterium]|nr:MAG: hypothetical protein DRH30_04820 [Deltaproteobacteria bacterium]
MKNLLVLVCSVLIFAFASTAFAEEPLPGPEAFLDVCAPGITGAYRGSWINVEVAGDSVRARWFPADIIRCMTIRTTRLPLYAARVQVLDHRIVILSDRVVNLQRQADSAEEGEIVAVLAVDAAVRGQREAEESRDAWHRSRALWFALGAVVTAAIVALTGYALGQAGD